MSPTSHARSPARQSPGSHIKAEGIAGGMGARLMAVVAEGQRCRVYIEPTEKL